MNPNPQAASLRFIPQIEPVLGPEERDELLKVVASGWITEAAKTTEFERMVAEFTGTRHATAAVNGTVTLFMGLLAADVGPGDEVIVPSFTMIASPNSVRLAGATPVFVDVDPETFCLDLDQVEAATTERTKAVMPVHMNGRSTDLRRLLTFAHERDLFVLEDAAQALGCYREGRHLGSWGHVGSFSFSTPKVITTGQGGVLVTNDAVLHQRLYETKDFGRENRKAEEHRSLGYNFKFTDFQAAVGVAQMRKLPERIERKKQMTRVYQQELDGVEGVEIPETDLSQVAPWFIDILLKDEGTRKRVREGLTKQQIGTRPFYAPCHEQGPYRAHGGDFPVTTEISRRGLWLPSTVSLTGDDIVRVCQAIKSVLSAA